MDDVFGDAHGAPRVIVTATVKREIARYRVRALPNETGGVLVGDTSGALVRVLHATSPPRDSTATPTSFTRGTRGLVALLQRRWAHGQYYVGEWHAHPDAASEPSARDLRSLDEIARDGSLNFACPTLLVAGGPVDAPSFTIHVRWLDGTIERMTLATSAKGEDPTAET